MPKARLIVKILAADKGQMSLAKPGAVPTHWCLMKRELDEGGGVNQGAKPEAAHASDAATKPIKREKEEPPDREDDEEEGGENNGKYRRRSKDDNDIVAVIHKAVEKQAGEPGQGGGKLEKLEDLGDQSGEEMEEAHLHKIAGGDMRIKDGEGQDKKLT